MEPIKKTTTTTQEFRVSQGKSGECWVCFGDEESAWIEMCSSLWGWEEKEEGNEAGKVIGIDYDGYSALDKVL